MKLIKNEDMFLREELIRYNAHNIPVAFDIITAMAAAYHMVTGKRYTRPIEDIAINNAKDFMWMYHMFVQMYERKYGKITNANGTVNKSTIPQVLIGIINDKYSHEDVLRIMEEMITLLDLTYAQ